MLLLHVLLGVGEQLLVGLASAHQPALTVDDLRHDDLLSIGDVSESHGHFREVVVGLAGIAEVRGPA